MAQRPADRGQHGGGRRRGAQRGAAALDDTGMRIYVEYDKDNPDLVRVQDRNAALAIIPAGSIAVVGWLVAGAALFGLAFLERRLARQVEDEIRLSSQSSS